MTKEEFILQAVLSQMSPLMLTDHSQMKDTIIHNAKVMAEDLEKEGLFK